MKNITEFLETNEFILAAEIVQRLDTLKFKFERDFLPKGLRAADWGWVYIWVGSCQGNMLEALYVGKAGKNLRARCLQHEGGFCNSVTGKRNARRIRDFFNVHKFGKIEVYARHADLGEKFGISGVSMCEFEEAALMARLRADGFNLWNFQQRSK